MRKLFKQIHLWISVPVGLIISIVCLTGALLVFEKEITRAVSPHLYTVDYTEGATPLKPSQIVALINNQISDTLEVNSLQTAQNPEEAWMVSFKNAGRRQLSINPYSGEINGWVEGSSFFQIASLATGCSCSERSSVNRKNHCRHKYPAHGGYSDIRFSNLVAP